MQVDVGDLIKNFDFKTDGRARCEYARFLCPLDLIGIAGCVHSAFCDPNSLLHVQMRQSIESRVMEFPRDQESG